MLLGLAVGARYFRTINLGSAAHDLGLQIFNSIPQLANIFAAFFQVPPQAPQIRAISSHSHSARLTQYLHRAINFTTIKLIQIFLFGTAYALFFY
jgi:hypothetical protein